MMTREQDASVDRAVREHVDALEDRLQVTMRAAVADGMRDLLRDEEAVAKFWRAGYAHLTDHAYAQGSQWIGKRILVAAVAALFIWAMGWLVRNGALK